jgi:hypothetical protein
MVSQNLKKNIKIDFTFIQQLKISIMSLKSKEILLKSLYWAFTLIRAKALETKNDDIFELSNLLNNVPLQLLKAKTKSEYDKILAELEEDVDTNIVLKNFLNQVKGKVE